MRLFFGLKLSALTLPLIFMLFFSMGIQAVEPTKSDVRIGVLAKRGDMLAVQRWQPTADYLSREIPKHHFTVVPLSFVDIDRAVAKGEVEFVLANSAIYVGLEKRYGSGRIVTMRNRNGHRGYTVFGGVIFTRADRKDINTLKDIVGKRFAAVHANSFGGYHMAWREMERAGITPSKDTMLQFSGTHDAVVSAVLQGKVDAGTVRSDTLERMSAEGKLDLADIKLLNQRHHNDFGYLHSTDLYPEWPFVRVAHASEELSHDVAMALLRMSSDSHAALAGHISGWTVPGNYHPVRELLQELRVAPYAEFREITFMDLLRHYRNWLIFALVVLLLLGAINAYVTRLNMRLRRTEIELRSARDNLLEKVKERTAELEDSHQRLERISRDWNDAFDAISDPIFIHDTEMRIVQANPAYCKCAGHDLAEMLGKPYYHYFPRLEAPLDGCVNFPEHPPADAHELQIESGEVFISHSYGIRRADNSIQHAIHIMEDVTAEKIAESELKRLNRALRTLSLCNTTLVHADDEHELMDDISHILIENGGYRYVWVGYVGHDEVIRPVAYAGNGGKFQLLLNECVDNDNSDAMVLRALQQGRTMILRDLSVGGQELGEWCEIARESGFAASIALPLVSQKEVFGVISIFSVEANAFDDAEIELLQEMAGDLAFGIHTLRSHSKREKAEVALQKTEERYEELYENAPSAYLSVSGTGGKLIQFNKALCDILGYTRAELSGVTIAELYADTAYGLSRAAEIFSELASGNGVRDEELQMRHADGHAVWVSVSIDPVFDAAGNLLESRSTMIDISARKHAEDERVRVAEQLQRSLLQAIRAIALTIEKRDPYTAGHQERVADLAVKIGLELGLDDYALEGIKLGALIHDLGKISIPAEILSRPGALGPEMYSIIKTHPSSGYEIIGGIEFPWPLAEMVLQHHERIDGSGYPNGLKGDEILFEARILAVADVIEAMASHRPYRASLGMTSAMEEIQRGRGTAYDPQVVDACLKIFSDEQEVTEWVRKIDSR